MMTRSQITELGRTLSRESEKLSNNYHVKSDQHEILGYEAAVLAARSQHLETGEEIQENLRESTLLGAWGNFLTKEIPDFTARVTAFHREYERLIAKDMDKKGNMK